MVGSQYRVQSQGVVSPTSAGAAGKLEDDPRQMPAAGSLVHPGTWPARWKLDQLCVVGGTVDRPVNKQGLLC